MTTDSIPLLLITADPSHPLAQLALRYAQASLQHNPSLNVFFYGDGAHTANRLRWQSAEQINITQQWQTLATEHAITLSVCVSTALSRGISDIDNSGRHQLQGDNMANHFQLVGLSELAIMMQNDCRLISF